MTSPASPTPHRGMSEKVVNWAVQDRSGQLLEAVVDCYDALPHRRLDPVLLVRLWSWKAAKLEADAQTDYDLRRSRGLRPDYSVSTYGRRMLSGDDAEEAFKEVCLFCRDKQGLRVNRATWVLDWEVRALGMRVRRTLAVERHYDVVIGEKLDAQRVAQLEQLFERNRRNKPCTN